MGSGKRREITTHQEIQQQDNATHTERKTHTTLTHYSSVVCVVLHRHTTPIHTQRDRDTVAEEWHTHRETTLHNSSKQ